MPEPTLSTTKPMVPAPGGNTGPATVPPTNQGKHAQGVTMASRLAMPLLMKAAELLNPDSDAAVAVHDALAKLSKVFRDASKELGSQEMKLLQANAPQTPTASPEQQLAMQKMQGAQRMNRMAPAMASTPAG